MEAAVAAVRAPQDCAAAAQSRGSSFYFAMRMLPQAQRDAMFEIYSFCRAVDDIADDGGPLAPRRAALAKWRRDIDALYAGSPPPEMAPGLIDAVATFRLERDDFHAVIDGMEMDLAGDIRAPDLATLDLYCDRVASAVGRLSVKIFGVPQAEGRPLAFHLGRALQLTNILRDLDEDAAIGRLYLPRETLASAGVSFATPEAALADPGLDAACAPVILRAKDHFHEARAIMARCPRQSIRAPMIMADAYEPILAGLAHRGFAPPRKRIRTSKWRVLVAILRHGLI
nr:presqualene diphosphate synthase HpnD [Methylocella silvestris]